MITTAFLIVWDRNSFRATTPPIPVGPNGIT